MNIGSNKKIISMLCALAFTASIGCQKDDSKKEDPKVSILGASTKPGYLPNGEKVNPLTKDDLNAVAEAMRGTLIITNSVSKAVEVENAPGNAKRISLNENSAEAISQIVSEKILITLGNTALVDLKKKTLPEDTEKYSSDLTKKIKEDCSIKKMEIKNDVQGSQSGNSVSGTVSMFGDAYISPKTNKECLVRSESLITGSANFNGTKNSKDEMESLFASGSVKIKSNIVANEKITLDTGFLSQKFEGNINGSFSANQQSVNLFGEVQFDIEFATSDFGTSKGKLLSEVNLNGKPSQNQSTESNVGGVINLTFYFESNNKIILIQIFGKLVEGSENQQFDLYINGEKYEEGMFDNWNSKSDKK